MFYRVRAFTYTWRTWKEFVGMINEFRILIPLQGRGILLGGALKGLQMCR
jgi:hypothetical protein